jgi:tryptophan 7-halogenase
MAVADLIQLVETLRAPYGLERSVKITRGTLADDRCLISLGRAAFGVALAERLAQIGSALGMPEAFMHALPGSLEGADVVHLGYEAAAGRDVYKIYCEYASSVRRAMAARSRDPVLVHLAYKWTPQRADSAAVTRYTWVPCRTRGELEFKLQDLVPANAAPHANRCSLALVSRVAAFAASGELLLMEVEEPGNPRRSCDLNVYDAALRMGKIADLLEVVTTDFAVPPARAHAVFDHAADRMLGHLSAGVGRDGQEFVTFYFGVEAH